MGKKGNVKKPKLAKSGRPSGGAIPPPVPQGPAGKSDVTKRSSSSPSGKQR
jgi:hypothetical protein